MIATQSEESAAENAITPIPATACRSPWFRVTQDQIDSFAATTADRQWIHRDTADCTGGPFAGPIAHGLLTLSLGISLALESRALPDTTWVLYGFEKVRFRAPVRSGSRVRCSTIVQGMRQVAGRSLLNARLVLEIENEKVPALVADALFLVISSRLGGSPNLCERSPVG